MSNTPVQDPPALGGSSDSGQTLPSRALPPATDAPGSKRVCFYKSGDYKFSGHRMIITSRTFKTFDALLDALSKKVPLPFGVRTITTPRGTHLVRALDDLQDGGAYVCSDQKRVKPLNLDEVTRRQVPWNTTRALSSERRRRQGLRFGFSGRGNEGGGRPVKVTERAAVRTPRKLVVIKNKDPSVKRTIVLQRRTAPTFDALLDYLSQILQFPVLKLFSTDGRRVDGLAALILCSGVVVAAGKEPFKLGGFRFQRAGQAAQILYVENVEPAAQQARPHTGDHRGFYEALKAVYGPSHQTLSPLRSTDGQALLSDKVSILNRWSEHFQALFSADRSVDSASILHIPQQPVKSELDEPPTLEETTKATQQLKSGKAAGIDGIPPEIWKHGGPALHAKLHELFVCCWEQGELPKDLRDAIIITLYKNKGEKSDCSNYRGITLLSIAGKILARLLLNRLVPAIAAGHLPESQCGFRSNRSTTDMVFVLRQLQEKCREQNKGLYITFVDLTKAFDTVSRKGMWQILERLGCPPKFLSMVIQLHEGQRGQVRVNSDLSEPFPILNGVKQGCVLAPTLFSIFFSMMLKQATEDLDEDDSVYIRYRLDGSLFNLRRLQAHTKTHKQMIRELLFADDAALVAHAEGALQRITSCFADAAQLFGLEVSLKKTEVLYQPAPKDEYHLPHIKIGDTELKTVHQFTYLGCTITSDAKIDKDIDSRLAKASSAFGRLSKRVWNNKHLKQDTKISVYKAIVLTTLLYGSESWVTYRSHVRLLERFHQRCLRTILGIHWSDYVSNVEVLERAGVIGIEAMLLKTQLRWAGHVYRMEDTRLPKVTMYGELASGHRDRGAPKKRYKDRLKWNLNACHIDDRRWSTLAADRNAWHSTIHTAVSSFEGSRIANLKDKRHRRKNRNTTAPNPDQTFPCSRCRRT
ncbi:hypothetical protein OJAV_G00176660 [Oryzias javanicus]|uniref:Reverse transcriptase domain-containing protein n=1 Tax=Oryzias javanicus TaxID=123683 RepID=A0A437CH84_ORYJA|nr:hypothetical protein OJAV_G00176660 [Oryzias javanicus]